MCCPLVCTRELENLLFKCKIETNLFNALRIHDYMKERGLETHLLLGNSLVSLFLHVKRISIAESVFIKLPCYNESHWNALIINHTQQDNFYNGLALYEQLREGCQLQPDGYAFVALLQACAAINDLDKGFQVYKHIQKTRLHTADQYVATALVDMFAKCGDLKQAQEIFDQLSERTVILWNALVTGYADCGHGETVLSCLEQMERDGLSADAVTYVCGLRACGSLGDVSKGWHLYLNIMKMGLDESDVMGSTLVGMFAKCGCLHLAQALFDKLLLRNVVSWNALITGFFSHGHIKEVLLCSEKMQSECISANRITLTCFLKACYCTGLVEKGQDIHSELVKKGLENDLQVGCSLVDVYAKWMSLDGAQNIFDNFPNQDAAMWNALIMGYAEQGYDQEALECFKDMHCHHKFPNSTTYVCALKACISMNAMDESLALHADIAKKGLEANLFIGSSLVYMYAKADLLLEAQCVFDKLPVQTVVIWNALISGYSDNGQGKEVLDCYGRMQDDGIPSDETTLVCAVKSCGNIGNIAKGQEIHLEIVKKGFSEKDEYVGSTLVDAYVSWRMFLEAKNVFEKLSRRDKFSFMALLAGYVEDFRFEDAFKLFDSIQCTSNLVSPSILVCILRAAGSKPFIQRGQDVHKVIIEKGLEVDSIIVSNLVHMYAKCGYLAEAQQILKSEQTSAVDSWTALISGYMEHVDNEAALNCFKEMQEAMISPSKTALLASMKACGTLGATIMGRELHAAAVKKGMEKDPFVANAVVYMLAKLCLLEEADRVFQSLVVHDVADWNALIVCYVEHQAVEEAISCFEQMGDQGVSSNGITLVSIVKACGLICWIRKAEEVYSEIIRKGLEKEPLIGSVMVDVYAKCGCLVEARDVFMRNPICREVSCNALIKAYTDAGHVEEGLNCFKQMQHEGISADVVTFICCLKGCSAKRCLVKGQGLHGELTKKGFDEELPVGNILIDMYVKCGLLLEAQKVFDKLINHNVISFTALMGGYVSYQRDEEALFCLQQMQQESITWGPVTYIWSLRACSNFLAAKKGQELHIEIVKKGMIQKEPIIGSALVDMYMDCGLLKEALNVFDKLSARDSISWTSSIVGLSENGFPENALHMFEEMKMAAASPDAVTLACMLNACSSAGATCKAKKIHLEIVKKGVEGEHFIGEVLLDVYSKCGLLTTAQEVFNKLSVRPSFSWNALIAGYAQLGECFSSFEVFEKMVAGNIWPDESTLTNLIVACNHAGLVDVGHGCIALMKEEFGIISTVEHYSCMLDLLGRAGRICAIAMTINEIPFQPDSMLWLSVIGACRKWHTVGLARLAFENAVSLDKKNAATYVVMANIYADSAIEEKTLKMATS